MPRSPLALPVPLPPAWFHILLALTSGPGTLYGALKRLLELGLLEESGRRPDPALDDERRRYYRLTHAGRRVLAAEAARHDRLVSLARAKRVLPRPRPA